MPLPAEDNRFLAECIQISARSLTEPGFTPFGAIVVVDGVEVGRGASSVMELHDPTAHAEVMALRDAGPRAGSHRLDGATMYCSGEPCPMCLVACWWAGITNIVTAATVEDSQAAGFEDRSYYAQLMLPPEQRDVVVRFAGSPVRADAAGLLLAWKNRH